MTRKILAAGVLTILLLCVGCGVEKPLLKVNNVDVVTPMKLTNQEKTKLEVKNVATGVTWTTSNPKIAKVSDNGLVTAKAMGTAKIVATFEGGTATWQIQVVPREVLGVFETSGWGDYFHLGIRTFSGKRQGFFVLKDPGVDVEKLKQGQKMKVYWQRVQGEIPEAGKDYTDIAVKVELVD